MFSPTEMYSGNGTSLIKSTDGGISWTQSQGALNFVYDFEMRNSNEAFALVKSGPDYDYTKPIAHTQDGGNTWKFFNVKGSGIGAFFVYGNTLFGWGGSGGTQIYRYKKPW